MSDKKYELIETLTTLIEAQEKLEQSGAGIVRYETSFLKEILEELEDKIDIFNSDGDLVCTISGPNASTIIDMAVREFVGSIVASFAPKDGEPNP